MDENRIKEVFSENLAYYRKKTAMTQAELAEKLGYSDKSISKWERGEGLPDMPTTVMIAEIFEVTLNDLVMPVPKKKFVMPHINKRLIAMMSIGLVWLVSVVVYVILRIAVPNGENWWLAFIYAIPVSGIVATVFSAVWANKKLTFVFITIIIWGFLLSLFLSLPFENNWLLFIIGIPVEIIAILWMFYRKVKID